MSEDFDAFAESEWKIENGELKILGIYPMRTFNKTQKIETSIFNFQLSIINSAQRGITLIEVLAAIFVISIGLLGVLAVIPFGIFQVSKARDAEHTANMLDAATADVGISGMTLLGNWLSNGSVVDRPPTYAEANGGAAIQYGHDKDGDGYVDEDSSRPDYQQYKRSYIEDPANTTLKCNRFIVIDPQGTTFPSTGNNGRFYKVVPGAPAAFWQKITQGQDDLVYTTHRTRLSRAIEKRTDFSGQGNMVASSGKYTWFCTFVIRPANGFNSSAKSPPLR